MMRCGRNENTRDRGKERQKLHAGMRLFSSLRGSFVFTSIDSCTVPDGRPMRFRVVVSRQHIVAARALELYSTMTQVVD